MTTAKIRLEPLRNLPVSAASGLVILGDYLHVVADDAVYLGEYSLRDADYCRSIRLCAGELPAGPAARKQQKPDFEALTVLPAQTGWPHGALLALGSGSGVNRQRGVVIPLRADGRAGDTTHTIDFSPLFAALPFVDTNIEGAFVMADRLVLMQRGNCAHPDSALVSFVMQEVLEGCASAELYPCALPYVDDTPLGFTDGIALPDGSILFSAVAEKTGNSYQDGVCAGSAIGLIDAQGRIIRCELLSHPYKLEGIALTTHDEPRLYAVTDADDPAIPAVLIEVTLPAAWWF